MTDDDEIKFVVNTVILMVVLGMTPLILFYVINLFYPEFLWIPVTPN